jgi:hypothetical protein
MRRLYAQLLFPGAVINTFEFAEVSANLAFQTEVPSTGLSILHDEMSEA